MRTNAPHNGKLGASVLRRMDVTRDFGVNWTDRVICTAATPCCGPHIAQKTTTVFLTSVLNSYVTHSITSHK